jgi:hypothetical protein
MGLFPQQIQKNGLIGSLFDGNSRNKFRKTGLSARSSMAYHHQLDLVA